MQMLQIYLPDDVASLLRSLHDKQSNFIAEAIQEKIAREKHRTLEAVLIEGYKATRTEDRSITEDFDSTVGDGL